MAFSITTFFTLVGFTVILYQIAKFFKFFFLTMYRKPFDLIERYGAGSWAVVTGASEGIGREFCLQLARRGFNIVLISRTKEKLDTVAAECKKENSNVKTLVIPKDFSKAGESGFFDDLQEKLSKLDISLLLNNAGVMHVGLFTDQTEEDINNHVNLNVLTVARMTKLLIKQMLAREKRGGIITVSSGAGRLPFGNFTTYSGTKAFDDFFTTALSYELADSKLDIMSLCPSTVRTNLSSMFNGVKEMQFQTVPVEGCVAGALNDLGHHRRTYGHWIHKSLGFINEMMPAALICSASSKKIGETCAMLKKEGIHGAKKAQ